MTAMEYLQKEFSKTEKYLHYMLSKCSDKEKQIKETRDKLRAITECIDAVEHYDSIKEKKPIPWGELQYRKSKPVYIMEKTFSSSDWFGWWDIIDEVFPKYIITAYSEELLKQNKGITWDIYDEPIK